MTLQKCEVNNAVRVQINILPKMSTPETVSITVTDAMILQIEHQR